MTKIIALLALALMVSLSLAALVHTPASDPYRAARLQLAYATARADATRQAARADAVEPFLRILLAALALAPVAALAVAADAWRLRRRLVTVAPGGLLPFPRVAIDGDASAAIAALGAFHATEYQRASPRLAVRDVAGPAPPALAMPTAPGDAPPALPGRIDLMDVLRRQGPPTPGRVLIGVGAAGPIYRTLAQMLHVGILGSTGSGKSTLQLALAVQLAMIEGAMLAVCDPDAATFQALARNPRLFVPFPDDGTAAARNLGALRVELNRRRATLSAAGAWDMPAYNLSAATPLAPVFMFVDELPALAGYADTEPALLDLAQRGRKVGMYLVVASPSMKKEDIGNTSIRQQFATKLLLKTGEPLQGRCMGFDASWAKASVQFSEPGLAVFRPNDGPTEVIRVPYVSPSTAAHALSGGPLAAPWRPGDGPETETVRNAAPEYVEIVTRASASDISTFPPGGPDMEKAARVAVMRGNGNGKREIIAAVWGATTGRRYQAAGIEYEAIIASLLHNGRG